MNYVMVRYIANPSIYCYASKMKNACPQTPSSWTLSHTYENDSSSPTPLPTPSASMPSMNNKAPTKCACHEKFDGKTNEEILGEVFHDM